MRRIGARRRRRLDRDARVQRGEHQPRQHGDALAGRDHRLGHVAVVDAEGDVAARSPPPSSRARSAGSSGSSGRSRAAASARRARSAKPTRSRAASAVVARDDEVHRVVHQRRDLEVLGDERAGAGVVEGDGEVVLALAQRRRSRPTACCARRSRPRRPGARSRIARSAVDDEPGAGARERRHAHARRGRAGRPPRSRAARRRAARAPRRRATRAPRRRRSAAAGACRGRPASRRPRAPARRPSSTPRAGCSRGRRRRPRRSRLRRRRGGRGAA